ncbi:hypothetical protein [Azospira sp. I09]|uniref:hypothetical protein n=1 Tax=Azospira sp. I09 TaxID=1765049 RepID=UPI0012606626|nr:hypothetical protein [Azospira sp. I09]BBN90784.1 hypothetical protein AZSP09_38070 [Azospira sp. I09]
MTTQTSGNYEHGYRAVLVREDTKKSLRKFRADLTERDLFQERRIATAALEIAIEDASRDDQARERLFARVKDVVRRDLDDDKAT